MNSQPPCTLELTDVCLEAGNRRILDRIDLKLGGSAVSAIIGANGAGKSVLLRVANGLLRPQQGSVRFEGRPAPSSDSAFEGQALVFQHPSMLRMSVLDNLMLARHALGESAGGFRDRALGMLARLGLAHLAADD
jgi:tungstate transport system ATP-binding protein